jgi:hypothetical protein
VEGEGAGVPVERAGESISWSSHAFVRVDSKRLERALHVKLRKFLY